MEAANTGDGRLILDEDANAGAGQIYPEYHHKDHLGNTRVAFTDRNENGRVELLGTDAEVTQQLDYYPFGLQHEGEGLFHEPGAPENRYRYNGKEFDEDLGLYDYGARWYDPAIARWISADKLAERAPSLTPYRYGFNNPILYIDPDGNYEKKKQAKRARRRAKRLGHVIGDIYRAEDGEYGFRYDIFHHAFKGSFFGGSKFAQLFKRNGRRGGLEVMTGSGHPGSGSLDSPEGTSSAIIDGLILPFGGNFGTAGNGFWKGLTNAIDQSTNAMSVAPGVGEIIDGEESIPRVIDGRVFGDPLRYGPDTLPEVKGCNGCRDRDQRQIIFYDGKAVDTLP